MKEEQVVYNITFVENEDEKKEMERLGLTYKVRTIRFTLPEKDIKINSGINSTTSQLIKNSNEMLRNATQQELYAKSKFSS